MIQKYDNEWSVFGINVPKRLVNLLGALLAVVLLLVVGVAAGARFASTTSTVTTLPPPPPVQLDAYADGVSAKLLIPNNPTTPTTNQPRPLYVVAYPFNGSGCAAHCNPEPPLVSGHTPLCYDPNNQPCFLTGLDPRYGYHDLIVDDQGVIKVTGISGYQSSWYLVVVEYNEAWTVSNTFRPFTSADDLRTALGNPSRASTYFAPLRPSASGAAQYQIEMKTTLVSGQLIATPTNTAPPPTPTPAPTKVGK